MQEAPVPCPHALQLAQELPLLAVTVVDVRDAEKSLLTRSSQMARTRMVFLGSLGDERISASLGMLCKSLLPLYLLPPISFPFYDIISEARD